MRHDWIFDVLGDLRAYAEQNDLPALAAQVTAALKVADVEIADEATALMRRLNSPAHEDADKPVRRSH